MDGAEKVTNGFAITVSEADAGGPEVPVQHIERESPGGNSGNRDLSTCY